MIIMLCGSQGLLQLRLMARDNNLVLTDSYGPGHCTTVNGATVYVTQCIPQNATIRSVANCTQDLPIFVPAQNRTAYCDPISFNIKPSTRIFPCSPIQPARACAMPQLQKCPAPEMVEPIIDLLPPLRRLDQDLSATLYTNQKRQAHERFMDFAFSRQPILDSLAKKTFKNTGPMDVQGCPLLVQIMTRQPISLAPIFPPRFTTSGNTGSCLGGPGNYWVSNAKFTPFAYMLGVMEIYQNYRSTFFKIHIFRVMDSNERIIHQFLYKKLEILTLFS